MNQRMTGWVLSLAASQTLNLLVVLPDSEEEIRLSFFPRLLPPHHPWQAFPTEAISKRAAFQTQSQRLLSKALRSSRTSSHPSPPSFC